MQRVFGSPFAGFVPKPYSLKDLQSVLQSILSTWPGNCENLIHQHD